MFCVTARSEITHLAVFSRAMIEEKLFSNSIAGLIELANMRVTTFINISTQVHEA